MPTTLRGSDNFDTAGGNAVKAWVNFNGTITSGDSRRASFNVSSVVRNGTGDYTVNFATAMPDANYSATGSGQNISGFASAITFNNNSNGSTGLTNPTTTAFRFTITAAGVGPVDSAFVNVAFFR